MKLPALVIEYANQSVNDIFGYYPDECIGKKTELFYPDKLAYRDFGGKLRDSINKGEEKFEICL